VTHQHTDRIQHTAQALLAPPRGILAVDESPGTMSQRLERVGVAPTATARRDYREMLLTTPELARSISGAIFADETFGQELSDGRSVSQACSDAAGAHPRGNRHRGPRRSPRPAHRLRLPRCGLRQVAGCPRPR